LNVDEYLAQFDDLESTVHGIQDEAQPLFEKEWIRFISNLRIQLSFNQKSIDPATKRKMKKRMQDKVRRETKTLTDLIASHTKRLHEPMATYLDSFLAHISRRIPREISFDEIYQKVAKAEAERIMENYKSRIEDIMDQAEDEESLQKEMDSFWGDVEKRARMVSKTVTVKMSNQVLQIHYQKYGFDEKMWKAEKDACPYCAKLNGRIVSMDGHFAYMGQVLEPQGVQPMEMNGNLPFPPLHPNCRCMMVPVAREGNPVLLTQKPQDFIQKPVINNWRKPLTDRRIRNYQQQVKKLLENEPTMENMKKAGALLHNEIERRYEKIYQEYDQTVQQLNQYLSKGKLTEEEEIKKNELLIQLFRQERRKEERMRDIRLQVLSQFQEFGYSLKDPGLRVFTMEEDKKKDFERLFRQKVAPYLPRSILEKISQKPMQLIFEDGRPMYEPVGTGVLTIPDRMDRPSAVSDLLHEIMHRVEHIDGKARQLEEQYYQKRVLSVNPHPQPMTMSELMIKKYHFDSNEELHKNYDDQWAFDARFEYYYNNVCYLPQYAMSPEPPYGFYELLTVGAEVLFGANGVPPTVRNAVESDTDFMHFLYGWWVSAK
ncbi:MAG: phage minor head protein, partial [Thermoactinomyces sp.]